MADNNPSLPGGAVPPKPPEGSKIQPKKETVRINLPPKPSAAPTIKLPTLPPGGPTGAPNMQAPAAPAPAPAPPRATAAPVAQRPIAPRAPAPAALSPVDMALAIAAAVLGLVA